MNQIATLPPNELISLYPDTSKISVDASSRNRGRVHHERWTRPGEAVDASDISYKRVHMFKWTRLAGGLS